MAGIEAGMRFLTEHNSSSALVVVLAADLPFAVAAVARLLTTKVAGSTGVRHKSMRQLIGQLDPTRISIDEVAALDCDLPADLERARNIAIAESI